MKEIKGIIFDYGGTIDTNGIHWGEVIREEYHRSGVKIEKALFREAYVYAERALAKAPIIARDDTFHTLLRKKMALQAEYLKEKSYPIDKKKTDEIADGCYRRVLETLATSRNIVELLAHKFPTVLVTNFYGNMPVVLKEFRLDEFFGHIVESAVVGLRKPNPALFAKGVEALGLQPYEVLVIGDSYRKDIYPARTLGCKAVWLKRVCWEEEAIIPGAEPTAMIDSLEELPALIIPELRT